MEGESLVKKDGVHRTVQRPADLSVHRTFPGSGVLQDLGRHRKGTRQLVGRGLRHAHLLHLRSGAGATLGQADLF